MNISSKPILFDFARPIKICQWCGYPFTGMRKYRHIDWLDCPEHMPGWWKHKEELNIDKANDTQAFPDK